MIEFTDDHGHARTAVYLPEVMAEQGWSKAQTIDSLVRKAGVSSPITDALRARITLTRYRSTVMECSYEEWANERRSLPNPPAAVMAAA